MCKCTPSIRTPFCGRAECTWPKPAGPCDAFAPVAVGNPARLTDVCRCGRVQMDHTDAAITAGAAATPTLADDCDLFAASVDNDVPGTPWSDGCARVLRQAAKQLRELEETREVARHIAQRIEAPTELARRATLLKALAGGA